MKKTLLVSLVTFTILVSLFVCSTLFSQPRPLTNQKQLVNKMIKMVDPSDFPEDQDTIYLINREIRHVCGNEYISSPFILSRILKTFKKRLNTPTYYFDEPFDSTYTIQKNGKTKIIVLCDREYQNLWFGKQQILIDSIYVKQLLKIELIDVKRRKVNVNLLRYYLDKNQYVFKEVTESYRLAIEK